MLRLAIIAASASLAACATTSSPMGLQEGQFVSFDCEGSDFQARWNAQTKTVRVRTIHGAAELNQAGDAKFEGDGFVLQTTTADGTAISHSGKVIGKNCKKV